MLHLVNVTMPIYIYLKDDDPSNRLERLREIAEQAAVSDDNYYNPAEWSYHSTTVEKVEDVPEEWRNAFPFGDNVSLTCEEILAKKTTEKDINNLEDINNLVLTALVGLQNNNIDSVGITGDGCSLSVEVSGVEWEIKMVKKREYK